MLRDEIIKEYEKSTDKIQFLNEVIKLLYDLHPLKDPVTRVLWVPIDKVEPNEYNPNKVAERELKLLHISIKEDGYTQPVVTFHDKEKDKYIIVDGFHRYFIAKKFKDIRERNKGYIPIVVIDKDIAYRMASTVRHNRARGYHQIMGMGSLVFKLLDAGWTDEMICNELGMEADELVRLKHITGFSKLFENVEYKQAWETKKQILLKKKWKEEHPDEKGFEYD